jgi:hypothetical protein
MHTLLAATKDPPIVNRPKKSKTKKTPIKAITKATPAAPPVPSANEIATNKSKITLQALNLPFLTQMNQPSATTEAANIQTFSVTSQPKKPNKTKRVSSKASHGSQSPNGSEGVITQLKAPLQALNLPVTSQTIQAPVASESASSLALIASTKPKKVSKAKKAASKAIACATEISLVSTATHIATNQGQTANETANNQATAASIRTKKSSKTKKTTAKVTNTDVEHLESPNTMEAASRQTEVSAALRSKKPKGKKVANKGSNSANEISEAPSAIQMVTNHALSVTVRIRRGSRARKAATKARATENQTQIADQGAQGKIATSQTSISALETQVAAAVQALADDYLAQLSLEPTTRTRGKRNRKVRSVTSSFVLLFPSCPCSLFVSSTEPFYFELVSVFR